MHDLKLPQLKYEIESCRRLLNFIAAENVHVKNRLSEVVKDKFETTDLEEIEDYLGKFITQDEQTSLLQRDISIIEKRLLEKDNKDGEIGKDIYFSVRLLHSNIIKMEGLFLLLCGDFNNFLVNV